MCMECLDISSIYVSSQPCEAGQYHDCRCQGDAPPSQCALPVHHTRSLFGEPSPHWLRRCARWRCSTPPFAGYLRRSTCVPTSCAAVAQTHRCERCCLPRKRRRRNVKERCCSSASPQQQSQLRPEGQGRAMFRAARQSAVRNRMAARKQPQGSSSSEELAYGAMGELR
jgi:hypothetical protein